jgi:DNA ligase-1
MIKIKRFTDGEAVVVGVEEQMHNTNEATTNALGYTERSSHQANQIGTGALGAFLCRSLPGPDDETDVEFSVGTGMTAADRTWMWNNREQMVGKIIKYKSFPVGVKDKPRHPVFLGFRDAEDL